MGTTRSAAVAAPGDRVVSQKRLLQAGSLAAALASILGLVFTVGDRVTGQFSHGQTTAHVQIDDLSLTKMSLRTFLVTKKAHVPGTPFGYGKKELDDPVLVVDVRARYAHSSRGVPFPVKLTLEARRARWKHRRGRFGLRELCPRRRQGLVRLQRVLPHSAAWARVPSGDAGPAPERADVGATRPARLELVPRLRRFRPS